MSVTLHREVVKAAIRMEHGSIEAFAVANGIKSQLVRDLLRGQSSAAKVPVAKLLGVDPDHLEITCGSTSVEMPSTPEAGPHRLSAKAR